ncbi:hypothetical protein FRC10_008139 [Ceratobasidium sp. 414]|nr:hypothetical protein FRC10_008139 [Ceratobasidium sp. 414]
MVGRYGAAMFHLSEERNNYISGSLISPSVSSRGLYGWSGSVDRTRPLAMKFHQEWQHRRCPVMRWYENQSPSSRKFRSIEHRRDTNGPFYHEFLLLKLADDAICRLERIGEGSRADAIRDTGCTANDVIQWFQVDDYDELASKHPSILISEVELLSDYDILDVLAICYSVQNTNACKIYTLQRYNCYFLCLTVLTVLTRPAASWETEITPHVWDWNLDRALARLWGSPAPEAEEYQILRICAQLHPNDPGSSESLLEEVYSKLCSENDSAWDMKGVVRPMLWLGSLKHETLLETARPCISAVLSSTQFSSIFGVGQSNLGQLARSTQIAEARCFWEISVWIRQILPDQAEILWDLYQMMGSVWPVPFKALAFCWIYWHFLVALMAAVHPVQTRDSGYMVASTGHISSLTPHRPYLQPNSGRIGHGDVPRAASPLQPEMDIVKPLRSFIFSVLLSTLKEALQRKPADIIVKIWVR